MESNLENSLVCSLLFDNSCNLPVLQHCFGALLASRITCMERLGESGDDVWVCKFDDCGLARVRNIYNHLLGLDSRSGLPASFILNPLPLLPKVCFYVETAPRPSAAFLFFIAVIFLYLCNALFVAGNRKPRFMLSSNAPLYNACQIWTLGKFPVVRELGDKRRRRGRLLTPITLCKR